MAQKLSGKQKGKGTEREKDVGNEVWFANKFQGGKPEQCADDKKD